ncbi:hypothetical protein EB796_019740 [Bugula neritina]|uniref:Uncharacterized protein n=1 Tax=Bugula neritina TaxID=10212 RepID=A0A7J7J875_BUGNE|nr:hypothetical protein EB796_019740 [Bugula neritina]
MQEVHLGSTPLAQPGGANNDHLSDQIPDHSSVQVKVHSGGTLGTLMWRFNWGQGILLMTYQQGKSISIPKPSLPC